MMERVMVMAEEGSYRVKVDCLCMVHDIMDKCYGSEFGQFVVPRVSRLILGFLEKEGGDVMMIELLVDCLFLILTKHGFSVELFEGCDVMNVLDGLDKFAKSENAKVAGKAGLCGREMRQVLYSNELQLGAF
jgi:hypothetical protein